MKTLLTVIIGLLTTLTLSAREVTFAWNASPTTGITNYVLVVTQGTNTARASVSTNLTATIGVPAEGIFSVFVTAQKDGLESDPSNTLVLEFPKAPTQMRTLAVEHSITLTNGWNDVGFFRLRVN